MELRIVSRLSQAFVTRFDRRSGLVGIVAGVFGASRMSPADAGPSRRHEKLACRNASSECVSDDQCCSGRCLPRTGGTGFRCAKRHRRTNHDGNRGGSQGLIALGEPCVPGVDTCARGTCQEYDDPSLDVICPAGYYCTLDYGDRCPGSSDGESNALPSSACVGLYCARPSGNARDAGVCGTVEAVDSCNVASNTCVEGSVIYTTFDLPGQICGTMAGGPAAVVPGSRTSTTCTTDGDCEPGKVCVTAELVDGNACRALFGDPGEPMGYCYTGYYPCDANGNLAEQCPVYPGYTVVSCGTVNFSYGTYCGYQLN